MNVQIFENSVEDLKKVLSKKVDGYWYSEDCILALVCLDGSARLEIENGDKYDIEKGKYALIFRKRFRYLEQSALFRVRILKVNLKFLSGLMDFNIRLALNKLFCRPRVLTLSETQYKIYHDVTRHLQALIRNSDLSYAKEIITGYLQVFTYSSLWAMEKEEQDTDAIENKREYDIADRFITLVKEHYMESRKVSYYAQLLDISPKYLSVLVKKATDRQPTEWIDDYTVNEIMTRLTNTDQPIQLISEELGFSSPSHMTKFFHDKTGSTPKEYRRSKNV